MGNRITKLNQARGFCANTARGDAFPGYGLSDIPVSTTPTPYGAIAGVGSTRGARRVRWGVARVSSGHGPDHPLQRGNVGDRLVLRHPGPLIGRVFAFLALLVLMAALVRAFPPLWEICRRRSDRRNLLDFLPRSPPPRD
jgi:hypothetical protein